MHRIGLLTQEAESQLAASSLRSAGERLNCEIVFGHDTAFIGSTSCDFVVTSQICLGKPSQGPTFAIVRDVKADFWGDGEWLARLSGFDGYFTVSDRIRQFLNAFYRNARGEPLVGIFELTPARKFTSCPLEKLVRLGAFRICHFGREETKESRLLQMLSTLSWFRANCLVQRQLDARRSDHSEVSAFRTWPRRSAFAAFGAGLVLPAAGDTMDATTIFELCEIVSVGAVAFCPDIPWVRQHFGESVFYYPSDDPVAATDVIREAMGAIAAEPAEAAVRARDARAIFEDTFAAEVMIQNAINLFEEWRTRAALDNVSSAPGGTVIKTDPPAIENIFSRLPLRTVATVGRAVAELNPLRPTPHWRFGGFTESTDLAVHVRHSLWRTAKARGGAGPVVVPWHAGTRLNMYLDNDLSLTLFSGGSFEPNEFALLDRILQPGMVFLDGGANEGVYTIFAAARIGPKGRVIAVEPSAREIERLKSNVALNRLKNVRIIEAALAERAGSARLLIAEDEHAGQNTLGEFAYAIRASSEQRVVTTTLDDLVEQVGLDRVDVLKLDVEGSEARALSAGWRVLQEMKPLVLAEISETALGHQGYSAAALIQLLRDAGYIVLVFDEHTGQPTLLKQENRLISDNIVAVHRERDWEIITPGTSAIMPYQTARAKC